MSESWTAILQAIASIPIAINNLKGLLSSGEIDSKASIEGLTLLQQNMIKFCGILDGVKEDMQVHQYAMQLDIALNNLRREIDNFDYRRSVEKEEYNSSSVINAWRMAKDGPFTDILHKKMLLRHCVCTCNLDHYGSRMDIMINLLIKEQLNMDSLRDLMDVFISHVKIHIKQREESIRERIDVLSDKLHTLKGGLE